MYWGQNNGEKSLGSYCSADSGIDVLVLSFLYVWGGAVKIPYGNFGEQCAVLQDGTGQNCDQLIADIKTCKSAGKKVLLSLGGASGSYSLGSADEATTLANAVWNSYAAPGSVDASAPRPLGDAFVDGFDMDIEASSATTYLADLVTALRANFAKDTAHTVSPTYLSHSTCPMLMDPAVRHHRRAAMPDPRAQHGRRSAAQPVRHALHPGKPPSAPAP